MKVLLINQQYNNNQKQNIYINKLIKYKICGVYYKINNNKIVKLKMIYSNKYQQLNKHINNQKKNAYNLEKKIKQLKK